MNILHNSSHNIIILDSKIAGFHRLYRNTVKGAYHACSVSGSKDSDWHRAADDAVSISIRPCTFKLMCYFEWVIFYYSHRCQAKPAVLPKNENIVVISLDDR